MEAGCELVAISPQEIKYNREIVRELNLDFPLLSDAGNQVAEQFGIVHGFSYKLKQLYLKVFDHNLAKYNEDGSWQLPMPSRYVVDTDGVIQYSEINADYKVRPEPEETVEVIREL